MSQTIAAGEALSLSALITVIVLEGACTLTQDALAGYQYRIGSSLLGGVREDAEYVVREIFNRPY